MGPLPQVFGFGGQMFQRSKQAGLGFFAQSAQPCINHIALPMVNIAAIGPESCHF